MELTILDTNLNKIEILDVFDSLIWTDRYSRCGDFEIFTKANTRYITSLQEDYYLSQDQSEHIMIVETINLKTDLDDGNQFIVRGRSLESILERRIVWKQTTLSGSLQNGIKKLLDENAISPSDPDRKITRLIFEASTDERVTSLGIDQQFTGDNLYDVIQQLCSANNIGFKITISPDNKFVFKLYAGEDRSFSQITQAFVSFSPELENISDTNYFHSKVPFKTMTLVGGEGEGSDRIMTQVMLPGGANTDLDRREKFTDARDVSSSVDGITLSPEEYYTLLYQRGILSLLESQSVSSFEGKVDPTVNYKFGIDFFMGDIVQIENEFGLTGRTRVTEVVFSEDLSGRGTYPTFEMVQ